jgi:hypothetical protein
VHQLQPGVRHVRVRHPFHERSQASDPEIIQSSFALRCLYTQPKDNARYPSVCDRLADAQRDVYGVSKGTLAGVETSSGNFSKAVNEFHPFSPATRQAPGTGLST